MATKRMKEGMAAMGAHSLRAIAVLLDEEGRRVRCAIGMLKTADMVGAIDLGQMEWKDFGLRCRFDAK
jgi:hypothetical protein